MPVVDLAFCVQGTTVKDKKVVGFPLQLTGLTADESLHLQEHDGVRTPTRSVSEGFSPRAETQFIVPPLGLGGRRTMACGIFVPAGPWPNVLS